MNMVEKCIYCGEDAVDLELSDTGEFDRPVCREHSSFEDS